MNAQITEEKKYLINREYIIETNDKLIFSYDFDNLEDAEEYFKTTQDR